ncbi:SemiSWEET transporter [uncultured Allomuricauda sp.]|uniref:SemiSWEET family sugar transporter n=1 Tax=Flagellimonas sp. W118 TaxID=3410791 RepID=UPI0026295109|nr:SemiSWEET transporter [uncultured Allomuricauda sp.]
MDTVEIIGLVAATLTTVAFVPQVFKAWKNKSTKDVSLTMYLILLTGIILWLYYGFAIKSLPIIFANAITGVLVLSILVLKIKHK